jgi:hypothetical protein
MKTAYGAVDLITDKSLKEDCQAIFDLLSTPEGMKTCRQLLRGLGGIVASAKDLAHELRKAEIGMGFTKYAPGV